MNTWRRHVVVIASGLVLAIAAWTITRLFDEGADGPVSLLSGRSIGRAFSQGWIVRDGLVLLVAVSVWTAFAFWIYRDRRDEHAPTTSRG